MHQTLKSLKIIRSFRCCTHNTLINFASNTFFWMCQRFKDVSDILKVNESSSRAAMTKLMTFVTSSEFFLFFCFAETRPKTHKNELKECQSVGRHLMIFVDLSPMLRHARHQCWSNITTIIIIFFYYWHHAYIITNFIFLGQGSNPYWLFHVIPKNWAPTMLYINIIKLITFFNYY